MANIDLLALEEGGVTYGLEGLKIMFWGSNAVGKSTVAMKFPKPLLLMAEAGGSALRGYKVPIKQKKDFLDVVKQLTDDKTMSSMKEKFQTIIIDCTEDVVEIFETALAKEYGVRDVGEIQHLQKGNPNGYTVYRKEFKQQINKLCSCGYTVIFISHEESIELEDGTTYLQPKGTKGEKSSTRFVRDLTDFRFYIKGNGTDYETGKVIKSTAYPLGSKTVFGGSRFDIDAVINPFSAENVINAIIEAQKRTAENEDANLEEFVFGSENTYTKEDYFASIKPYVNALFGQYPDLVANIIANQLGEGKKITDATDTQLVELESIYSQLVSLADERGIEV